MRRTAVLAMLAMVGLAGCGGGKTKESPRTTAQRACTMALTSITDELKHQITKDVFSQRMDDANVTAGEATKRDQRYATLVVGTEQTRAEVVQGVEAGPFAKALIDECGTI